MTKYFFFAFILLILITVSFAQPGRGGFGGQGGTQMPAAGRIYGKLVDARTKQPVEFASVSLLAMSRDSAVSGALAKGNGEFLMEKLPMGRYRLRVQLIGYKPFTQNVVITPSSIEQDLGNLSIEQDSKVLQEVEVQGEKQTVMIGIDRRVYNVDKDLSTRGGTGLDVMKNIPGLTVDAEGNVSLRNNSPTILVDGRPTTLTIEQIPADQIDRVEVITNPSAKFDAASTGGILNVVLKKNTKPGYNGSLAANVGTNNRYGFNGNLNVKENPFNFFISYNLNHRENPTTGWTYRNNLLDGKVVSKYNQTSENLVANTMQFGRIGFDYALSNRNTITLSQNIMMMNFDQNDNQRFSQTDAYDNPFLTGNRLNRQDNSAGNYTTQLLFKHTFPRQGKELTTDLSYNYGKQTNTSTFTTDNYLSSGILQSHEIQRNLGSGNTNMLTFQLDFTNPLTDTAKIEMGVRSNYKVNNSLLNVTRETSASPGEVPDPSLSNNYQITDMINAAYINYMNMFLGIGYQVGVRFEQTNFVADLPDKGQSFQYYYPNGTGNISKALFPSLFLSKRVNDKNEFQLNFSRKINRPGWMQIMPFFLFSDKKNYQIGNPALSPEFINMAEANYNRVFTGGNWLSSVYYRLTENPITGYAYNLATDSTVLVNTFINGNTSNAYGWENTLKFSVLGRKLDITMNANVFYTMISASSGITGLQNEGYSWNGKAILSYRLPWQFTAQVNGNYEAPRIIPQGTTREQYSIDFSLNKDIFKKFSLSLTVNDIFNTRRSGSVYDTEAFTQDLSRRREVRFVRLTATWRFGEWDVSLFKRKAPKRGETQQEMPEF